MKLCLECGMRADDSRPACKEMWDELLTRDFERAAYWRYHRLAVDAYCLQHPASMCASAKSFAAHLCGLCIALEMGNDQAMLSGLQRWLSTNPGIAKPDLPGFRGAKIIADLHGLEDITAYGRALEEWAQSVWTAYGVLHGLARDWIAESQRPGAFRPARP
jgi:hypothetical protein